MLRRLPYGANYLELEDMHELKYCIGEKILFRYQTTGDSMAEKMEQTAAAFFGTQYALGTHNCTEGLRVALLSTHPKVGDKVYIPAVTFVAVAGAVLSCGLIPVLVDVDEFLCMDMNALPPDAERVIVAHMEGSVAPLREGFPFLIEDAAQALGGRHADGVHAGAKGYCGVFSFHHNKILTSGEGGLIITNNGDAYAKMKLYHDHGCQRVHGEYPTWNKDTFYGENCVTSEIIASVQLQQFRHLEQIRTGLERGYRILREEVGPNGFAIRERRPGDMKLSLRLEFGEEGERSALERILKEKGLPYWTLEKYFLPDHPVLHYRNSIYADNFPWNLAPDYELPDLSATRSRLKRTICLPVSPELDEAAQVSEARAFAAALRQFTPLAQLA